MELWITDRIQLMLLLSACAVLSSLEAFVPLFQYQRGRWRRAVPNLALAFAVVLVNLTMASITAWLSAAVTRNHIGLLAGFHSHPWVLATLGVAGLDLFAYLAHLLLHKVHLGWSFHRMHHSELKVDVTTALRQHPGETLWRIFWQLLGTAVFGLPFWIVALYLILSSLNALLEHANVRMGGRFERWLRLLIVTSNMHKVHHSRQTSETDSNYSNIFSFWDRLYGTYTDRTNYNDLRYGLDGFDNNERQTLVGLLRLPFRSEY